MPLVLAGKVAVQGSQAELPYPLPISPKLSAVRSKVRVQRLLIGTSRGEEAQLVTTPKILFVPGAILSVHLVDADSIRWE